MDADFSTRPRPAHPARSSFGPRPSARRLGLVAGLLALGACQGTGRPQASAPELDTRLSVGVAEASALQPDWKERLAEAYVFVEHVGDYRDVGDSLRELFQRARAARLTPVGSPFVLYFDDPGQVPIATLRARACLPIAADAKVEDSALQRDVLPQAMVVYGLARGAYDRLPESYPVLLSYLREHDWAPNGPIREVYLVDPGSVTSWDELVAEVQIPWTVRR